MTESTKLRWRVYRAVAMVVIRSLVIMSAVASAAASVWLSTSAWAEEASYIGVSLSVWSMFVPAVLVVCYGVLGWVSGRSTLTWYASQTYLLGYLCTIAALVTLVFVLRLKPGGGGFVDANVVVRAIGIALGTTLAGLLGMTFLNHWRGPDEDGPPPEVTRLISKETSSALEGIRRLSDKCKDATGSVELLDRCLRGLGAAVKEFHGPVEDGGRQIQGFVKSTNEFLQAINKLTKFRLSPEVVESLERGINGVTKLDETSRTSEESLAKLEKSIKGANVAVENLEMSLERGRATVTDFTKSVKQLKGVLDDYVEVTSKNIGQL